MTIATDLLYPNWRMHSAVPRCEFRDELSGD